MEHEVLDIAKLEWDAIELADKYQRGAPYPHIVIDDFLPAETYRRLSAAFPSPKDDIWYKFKSGTENLKLQSQDFYEIPGELRSFITELNGPAFVNFLQTLTGIAGLIPDPHLYGGGLHQTLRGGHLGLHIDYNYHNDWMLDRRLNAIYYLNDHWEDAWGGQLELWDKDVANRVQKIQPIGNRLVVFNTDEFSWHGHPDPMTCPEGVTRRSIALYYYSNGRPKTEKAESHNTVFKARPGERFRLSSKELVRGLTPPLALKLAKKLLRKG